MAEEIPEDAEIITAKASLFTVQAGERTWYIAICDERDLSTCGTDRETVVKDLLEWIALGQGIDPSQVSVRDKTLDDEEG